MATFFRPVGAVAAALVVLASVAGLPARGAAGSRVAVTTSDWPAYERDSGHSSASQGDGSITEATVGALTPRWRFTAPSATLPGQPKRQFDASPTVVAGRVYIGSRTGMFSVLEASTGAVVWQRQLDFGSNAVCSAKGIVGTATVASDPVDGVLTVYAPGAHNLYALDAATGTQRWKASIGPDTATGRALYLNWASPTVAGGRIFTGLAANCESHLIRGGVVSLDQHTGVVEHTYYAVPAGKVGASVWSSASSDGKSVWVTTGNPDPSGTTIDDAYSVVRLSAATLVKQDSWRVPLGQSADLDFGSSPTMFTGLVGGVSTSLVGACNKNGVFYAWRSKNLAMGPVWSRKVGVSASATAGSCLASAAWDAGSGRLLVVSNQTTIAGTTAPGGLRSLDPATGAVVWERALPCPVFGSPTINGGLVAVPVFGCPSGVSPTVSIHRTSDGSPVGTVPESSRTFAQPVFAAGVLLVAGEDGTLTSWAP